MTSESSQIKAELAELRESVQAALKEMRRLQWCGIYTRQSRESEDEFSSCDAQFIACHEFIRDMFPECWVFNGRRYDDDGVSSETLERPGMQRLLSDIREGKVDRVVVYRLDRLSRELVACTTFLEELREREIPLTIVSQPELGITAEHTFILNLMASFAEFEQEMTRERMAEARAAHKRRGRRVAGVAPYGYNADPRTRQLIVAKREANRVRKMFTWAAEGQTPSEIAERANRLGWRTKTRTSKRGRVTGGGRWTPRQVLATLANPVYVGQIRNGDTTLPGCHEALVDLDQFEAVRAQMEMRQTRKPRRNPKPPAWPLRGLLHCGRCGRPMSPNTSGYRSVRYRYYRCRSTAGGKPACKGVRVPAQEIEDFVSGTLSDPEGHAELRPYAERWEQLSDLRRRELLPQIVSKIVFDPDESTISTSFDREKLVELPIE